MRAALALLTALVCAALTLGCSPALASPAPAGLPVTVTRVVDGDTVEATDHAGNRIKVRILGIDTPETKDPRKGVQCWGPQATAYAETALLGRPMLLVTDPTQDSRDRYNRVLAYLHTPDGASYSVEAARVGAARSYVYDRPVVEHPAIAAAETDARAHGRGLWGACT